MKKRIFISYANEDKGFVEKLYSDLQQAGEAPWMASVDLIPGQLWEVGIKKAIKESSYFIVVLSSRSVSKRGYFQKEIRQALEIAEELPEDEIFIIPVRIDECEPSFEGLKRRHRAELFPSYDEGFKELLRSFKYTSEEKPALVGIGIGRQLGAISKLSCRGFGIIQTNGTDFFFHASELQDTQFNDLREGDVVIFSMAESPKGPVAKEVSRA